MKELDRIDFEIIELLQNDARLTNKEIADQIGLAPSSCHARIRTLQESGVFKSFHAVVDETVMGVGQQALYFVSLSHHTRNCCEQFMNDMIKLPQVITVYQISGQTDFVIHAMAKDTASLRDFALDHITIRNEVNRIETAIIFNKKQNVRVPKYVEDLNSK